jgi:hypothetical protein
MRSSGRSVGGRARPAHLLVSWMLRRYAPVSLPDEFFAFYAASDGGEGELGMEPGWFALWRAEDIVSRNVEYELTREYPGYFGFGSNGGGEMLAFEVIDGRCGQVAMLAFIGGEPIVIADSFAQFIASIGIPYDPQA